MPWLDDIRKYRDELKRIDQAIVDALPEAAEVGAEMLAAEARVRAPRATGALADSIKAVKVEEVAGRATWAARVGAFYGRFLEYGTRKMSKRPYLRPAADTMAERIKHAGIGVIKRKAGR